VRVFSPFQFWRRFWPRSATCRATAARPTGARATLSPKRRPPDGACSLGPTRGPQSRPVSLLIYMRPRWCSIGGRNGAEEPRKLAKCTCDGSFRAPAWCTASMVHLARGNVCWRENKSVPRKRKQVFGEAPLGPSTSAHTHNLVPSIRGD